MLASWVLGVSLSAAVVLPQQRWILEVEDPEAAAALVEDLGGEVFTALPQHQALAVSLPVGTEAQLTDSQWLLALEPDHPRFPLITDSSHFPAEPDLPRLPQSETLPYGLPMVQAQLLDSSLIDGVLLCVVDSGYALNHEDLPSALVTGYVDSQAGPWYQDTMGHGTHVAGILAAIGGNGVGVVGVLPNADPRLHIVRVYDASDWTYSSTLVSAVDKCVVEATRQQRPVVINLSLGGPDASRFERRAFDSFHQLGALMVAAAGNLGNQDYAYPASYDGVISAAAVGENRLRASFSQSNDQVELAAPGLGVPSTLPQGYGLKSGTSMATPYIAGVAALVWSRHLHCDHLTLRRALAESALDLGLPGRDPDYGHGLVQAMAASDWLTRFCPLVDRQ
ncbi:S8 family peptidase [Ferrimonas marina]|uniref:Subtilase family protein n=1 Tax=Ferrimonas marina TaxID=299255 RepID=A0A1M5XC20_9GAMM|nr:S8 family peptidase [Ferrimonas marina]SHH97192.1 Subtilase family protein [Ferrimonas marina]